MERAAIFVKDLIVAILFLPLFAGIVLIIAAPFYLVGGTASAFLNSWPVAEYYIDGYLTTILPASWLRGVMRRADRWVELYQDPNRR
ncbi:hypothetical protein [Rhizobium ruizarguesonis]|uniref:hypothetical protein n=1 Tax=Rhizobium ruizarguesonis TaxID=2081791 RepID=UPI0010300048|nr:hypothetical protein [Rhizobium ruizarguesonis]TBE22899.1 hypothetical protein ELH08_08325 [Rhizobium ruizarguesonis]